MEGSEHHVLERIEEQLKKQNRLLELFISRLPAATYLKPIGATVKLSTASLADLNRQVAACRQRTIP